MKTSYWTKLLDIISPRQCVVCGHRLSVNESVLCPSCHLHLPLTAFHTTPYDNEMARLFWGKIPVEKASALFFFMPHSDTARIIYDMKYHGYPEVGEYMGTIAARLFSENNFFEGIDAIVPIPLTRWRQWKRGYNQTMEIARGIADATGLPIYNKVVRRIRFSGSQTRLQATERQDNVASAFQLRHEEQIRGLHLLLIDDIVTTGATVCSCARELCRASGVRISILSLGFTKS